MNEIELTLQTANNEATNAPYWLILDPKQNMSCDLFALANQITGPFFCREDATGFLLAKAHHFSKKAKVFCHSGHKSYKYYKLCKRLKV